MKKILVLAFLLIFCGSYSQSKWDLGVEYAINNLSLAGDRNYLVTSGGVNGYSVEYDQKNSSVGIRTTYRLGDQLGIVTGAIYKNKDFSGTYDCGTCEFVIYTREIIKQRFISIPIGINYTFLTGKFQPAVEGGLQNNLEIENSLETQSKGYFPEAYATAYFNYRFSDSWTGGVGYSYQAALSSLYTTDEFKLRTVSYIVSLRYGFDR